MFDRKLRALGYSGVSPANLEDSEQLRSLVYWIDETWVRHLKPDDLQKLYQVSINEWPDAISKYFDSLGCPWKYSADRTAAFEWLIRRCVFTNYQEMDCKFQFSNESEFPRIMVRRGDTAKGTVIENGTKKHDTLLDHVTDHSDALLSGVDALARAVGIQPHSNPSTTLAAVEEILNRFFADDPMDGIPNHANMIPLDEISVGLSLNDPAMEQPVKIMRLIHIRELRDLQTQMDEALVLLQKITANPQVDQKLGQVGR